jgi:hypothetical protein
MYPHIETSGSASTGNRPLTLIIIDCAVKNIDDPGKEVLVANFTEVLYALFSRTKGKHFYLKLPATFTRVSEEASIRIIVRVVIQLLGEVKLSDDENFLVDSDPVCVGGTSINLTSSIPCSGQWRAVSG